jgi:hypothetical protein
MFHNAKALSPAIRPNNDANVTQLRGTYTVSMGRQIAIQQFIVEMRITRVW